MAAWVEEAVRVWDAMAERRRSHPAHTPSRFVVEEKEKEAARKRENLSRNAARDKRRKEEREKEAALRKAAEEAAAKAAQLRKPSVVGPPPPPPLQEDTRLHSTPSPLPCYDDLLHACPPAFLSGVLRSFDFLHLFSQPLGFTIAPPSVKLPLFLSALLTPRSPTENHLINSLMAALLRTVLRTRAPPSTSSQSAFIGTAANPVDVEDVKDGVVCNALTWQHRLQVWLSEDGLRAVKRKQRPEVRSIAAFLSLDTFYQLPLQQRLFLLNVLTLEAVRSVSIRAWLHTGMESVVSLRKSVLMARNEQIHMVREGELFILDVAQCVVDLVDAVAKAKKKDREMGHTVFSLQKLQRAILRAEADRNAAEWEAKLQEGVDKWKLRNASIGVDRYYDHYWMMGGSTDHLLISHSEQYTKDFDLPQPKEEEEPLPSGGKKEEERGPNPMEVEASGAVDGEEKDSDERKEPRKEKVKAETAYTRWDSVSTKEQFNRLLMWLDDRGIREKPLMEALKAIKWSFLAPEPSKEEAVIASVPSSSSAPPPSASASPASIPSTTTSPLLRYEYSDVTEWYKSSLRASLVLMAEDGTANTQYIRCPLCQEAVDQGTERHCSVCHTTVAGTGDEVMLSHAATCKGEPPLTVKWKAGGVFVNDSKEEGQERDEVTVDLNAKLKPLIRNRKKVESESDSDSEDEEEPEDDDREDRAGRFAPKDEDEEKKEGEGVEGESSTIGPAADESAPPSTLSATPPPSQSKLATITRVTPRPTSLSSMSPNLQLLKAMLLDVEAAIPVEAVKAHTKASSRVVWLECIKLTCSLRVMGRGLSELGRNLKMGWYRRWLRMDEWVKRCWDVDSEAALAHCIFEFDRALIYSNDEKTAEAEGAAAAAAAAEEGRGAEPMQVEEEEEEHVREEVCQKCKSGEDAESLLLCDYCDREYHMDCLQPPLQTVPRGKWFCPTCRRKGMKVLTGKAAPRPRGRSSGSGSKKPAKGGEKKRGGPSPPPIPVEEPMRPDYGICKKCHLNEGDPLLCDRCDDAYHLTCLDPPLDAVPEGDWFCAPCKEEMREEEEAKRKAVQKEAEEEYVEEEEEESRRARQSSDTEDEDDLNATSTQPADRAERPPRTTRTRRRRRSTSHWEPTGQRPPPMADTPTRSCPGRAPRTCAVSASPQTVRTTTSSSTAMGATSPSISSVRD